jgi:hypothetical protein
MRRQRKEKPFKAVVVHDLPSPDLKPAQVYPEVKFFVIEGTCPKCRKGPNTLVWYDFIENHRDRSQNIFKTMCLACGDTKAHFVTDIVNRKDPEEPTPT